MKNKSHSIMPGIVLIAIGTWFLAKHLIDSSLFWDHTYPLLMLAFSGFLFWEYGRKVNQSALFWAIAITLVGALHLFLNYDVLDAYDFDDYGAFYLVAAGIGFIGVFVANPKDWGVLIPGTLLLFFGGTELLKNFVDDYWKFEQYTEDFWPAILIVIGAGVLISGFVKQQDKH